MNGFFSLGKTKLKEDLIPDFSSEKVDTKKMKKYSFLRVAKTVRAKRHKCLREMLPVYMKTLFTM